MNRKSILFLLGFLLFANLTFAQRVIKGKVTDAADGNPIPGVSVLVNGSSSGTTSLNDGNYTINVPANGTTLTFKYLGYITQEIAIGSRAEINVSLIASSQTLESVTVTTAFGITRERKALAYSAQTVTAQELNVNKQTNVLNALQGKVAGAQISSTGGAPGQGSTIRIRGINSIDPNKPNDPLFVIDGILIDNSTSTFGAGADLRNMSNRATDVNPEDIETISVLKGGAATALYGLRGSNGVVVITTKKGKSGKFDVNFSSTYGIENINKKPEIQKIYTAGILGAYVPIGLGPAFGPTIAEAKLIDPTHPDEIFDNYERAYRTGHQTRNVLTLSGGTEKVNLFSSFGYTDQEGMLPFTSFKSYNGRLNTDFKISEKFKTSVNMSFTKSGGDRYNADRFGESLSYFSGRWDVKDYLNPDGTQLWRGTNNPIFGAATNKMVDDVNRFIGGTAFNYAPTTWLSFDYRLGFDTYSDNRIRTAPGPTGIVGERLYDNADGFIGEYNTNFRAINSTFVASAKTKIGSDFNATFRLGHELYDRKIKNVGVLGTVLTIPDWFTLSNARIITPTTPSQRTYRLMGIFGEASIDYKNYLFLTFTGRNDITSTLADQNNSFIYPSASVSYVFSDHFKLPSVINFGKARFSYAQIGKDAGEYSTSTGYAPYIGLPAGGTGFTRASNLGDPGLVPEFTNTFEAGLEMSFFKSRIGLDFTFYNSISKDQIINANISSSTGYVTASINSGSMRNRGIELLLRGTPIQSKNFTWETSLNFSANRNKILSIKEGLNEIVYSSQSGYSGATVTMKLIPGEAYGNLYGTHYLRYYGTDAQDPLRTDKSRPIVIDANGFPVRAPLASQKLLGNSQPDWIGGITNTFKYKNFALTTIIDARFGLEKYNQLENFYAAFGIADYTADRRDFRVFDGVLANGSPNTKNVWLGQGVGPDGVNYTEGYYRNSYRTVSENFVQDASFVKLRTIDLSYTLPTKWLPSKVIKRASVSATANNIILYTPFYGLDPESSSTNSGSNVDGFAGFTYPGARTFLFSLNVGF
ncbi:MAG: SusC/RagA family TonB-linked outer membrane protein [Bacteroidota bacterium]